MKLSERQIDSKLLYEGRIVSLKVDSVELEDGHRSKREVVEHPDGVCIAAVDNDRNVYFVRQFRYPYQKVIIELPAGKVDKDECPFDAALRELREETGIISKNVKFVGESYVSPGFCDETIHMFVATDLEFRDSQLDDGEFLEVEKMNLSEAKKLVLNNTIVDGKTKLLILIASDLLDK